MDQGVTRHLAEPVGQVVGADIELFRQGLQGQLLGIVVVDVACDLVNFLRKRALKFLRHIDVKAPQLPEPVEEPGELRVDHGV